MWDTGWAGTFLGVVQFWTHLSFPYVLVVVDSSGDVLIARWVAAFLHFSWISPVYHRQVWSVLLAGADTNTAVKGACVLRLGFFLNDYHSISMFLLSHAGKDKYG